MPVRLAPFKMSELIQEIMSEVEPIIGRTRLEVTAHVPTGFPVIRSDRQKIKQILLNLLTNALKFTPRGSVTLTCTHPRRSRDIAIAVSDTGIGIAEADQARIFEPFSQADPAQSRDGGGTGLGLAICHRLAAVLGGRITLESKPRHGSTFTLSIPVGSRAS
jgi:signal transduction histidine kinase